jgi:hypothetical protein
MNNEIPPSTTTAPTAIAIAPLPLRPLSLDELVLGIESEGVVAVWVWTGAAGRPGLSGLVGTASAIDGVTATIGTSTSRATARRLTT